MPNIYCVLNCNICKEYNFPNDPALQDLWTQAVRHERLNGKKWIASINHIICYDHFHEADYVLGPTSYGNLYFPTLSKAINNK